MELLLLVAYTMLLVRSKFLFDRAPLLKCMFAYCAAARSIVMSNRPHSIENVVPFYFVLQQIPPILVRHFDSSTI
jgi:hypothetical protein